MAEMQHFRTAFRGFNREDVVHYIDYLNHQYNARLEQLQSQLRNASAQAPDPALTSRLAAAEARCAQLEEELAALRSAAPAVVVPAAVAPTDDELEAYRRAERAERLAQERAQQVYTTANAVLADVTLKAETASSQVAAVADQFTAELQNAKDILQEAVTALYAIRPED